MRKLIFLITFLSFYFITSLFTDVLLAQSKEVLIEDSKSLLNLNLLEVKKETSEKAVDVNSLKKRMNRGIELYYVSDPKMPYTGWLKILHENEEVRELFQIKNGLREGVSMTWYHNGKKTGEYYWKNGKKDGLSKRWYVNGRLKSEEIWDNGKIESVKMWKQSGEKCPITKIESGNGTWVEYEFHGDIYVRKKYENGIRIDIKYLKNDIKMKAIPSGKNIIGGKVIIASIVPPVEALDLKNNKKFTNEELKVGDIFGEGTHLKIGPGGKAVLLFSNGNVATIMEKTNFIISEYKINNHIDKSKETKNSYTLLDLKYGDLVVDVKKLNKDSSFELLSSLGVAGVRGTQFKIKLDKSQNSISTSEIIVSEGVVYCRPLKNGRDLKVEIDLKIGEKISYNSNNSVEALKKLSPLKAKKQEIEGIKLIITESRKDADILDLKTILGTQVESNKDRQNSFQKLRQGQKRK